MTEPSHGRDIEADDGRGACPHEATGWFRGGDEHCRDCGAILIEGVWMPSRGRVAEAHGLTGRAETCPPPPPGRGMTSLDEFERAQDNAQQQAWWAEAQEKPTREERDALVALAEEGRTRALRAGRIECAHWWGQVRLATLAGRPPPRRPPDMK